MAGKVITIAQQKGGSGKSTLAVNLAVAFMKEGRSIAILDTDPQGSLGRWFMTRRERLGEARLEFSTTSVWGVSYECEKLRKLVDIVLVDTPPKVDADLRPVLREGILCWCLSPPAMWTFGRPRACWSLPRASGGARWWC